MADNVKEFAKAGSALRKNAFKAFNMASALKQHGVEWPVNDIAQGQEK